jgi:guanylate cyclase
VFSSLNRWIAGFAGVTDSDSREQRLRKTLLVTLALSMSVGGVVWGAMYWAVGLPEAQAICFAFPSITAINLVAYRLHHHFGVVRFVQLAITLLVPFVLGLRLGGFEASQAVTTWSLLAPIGALLFCTEWRARLWFGGFVAVLILGLAIDDSIRAPSQVPPPIDLVFFAMNLGVPASVSWWVLRYFVRQNEAAMDALGKEQARSDGLLLNVLPAEIANVLKQDGRVTAERFDSVTVLFADVVGFTQLSTELSPEEMVELLNEIFSYFDTLTAKYDVEKIRTIGDNYMVASGAPRRREDHAVALVNMALDMNDYLTDGDKQHDQRLKFRIGLNSGPAVAGIVGRQKFHYDLWGDAVNVASRMESHGEPGRVQIGESTFELVGGAFDCEARGQIEVKGKGAMSTWWVNGRREAAPNA